MLMFNMRGNFFYKRLGERILHERKKHGFTQEVLAGIAEMDRTYLARIEEGKANPSMRMLHKIARKLHIKIYYLLKGV